MAIVVASMVIILVTAVFVLIAVFGMHLIARSPRARLLLRRWALGTGAWAYSVRREVAYRVRLLGRYARRRLGPHASRARRGLVVERTRELVERVAPVSERARLLITRVKAGIEYMRPLAPPPTARPNTTKTELVPVTALFTEPSGRPEARSDSADPRRAAR